MSRQRLDEALTRQPVVSECFAVGILNKLVDHSSLRAWPWAAAACRAMRKWEQFIA